MQEFIPPQTALVEPDPNLCPECRGRGWKVVADGGAGKAERCDCQKRDRGREYLALAGIPERYRACRLDNFQTAGDSAVTRAKAERAKKISQRFVDEFFDPQQGRYREKGLIYIGVPGTGKTHLAVAVLAELIERYKIRGRFVDFTALIHQIQSTFDPSSAESKHEVLDPVIQAEILVLDELGAQKPTAWVRDTLYLIMNTRYLRRLPTIFTTNYRLEDASRPGRETPREASREQIGLDSDAHAARQMLEHGVTHAPRIGQVKRQTSSVTSLSNRISAVLVSRLYEMAQPVELPNYDYRREEMSRRNRIGG